MGLLRKNYKWMSDDQRTRFVNALKTLKQKGVVDLFAQIHAQYFDAGIHLTSHFLPWHREMLYRFERELQKVDSSVTIPYWESPLDNNTSDQYFWTRADFLGPFNTTWNLRRALGSETLPTWRDVVAVQQRTTYDTFWWGTDEEGNDGLEVSIHNPPHAWVEGVMGTHASPGDPVFYLHHCWIDMLWALWQSWNPNAQFEARPSSGGWGLYDPMPAWTNPTRTPANVLDHRKLGYRYDTESWLAAGDELHPYDIQYSPSRNYMIWFASGRLYLRESVGNWIPWTSSGATAGTKGVMFPEGNLIISDNSGQHMWASNTAGHNVAWLSIQDPKDPKDPRDTPHLVFYDTNGNPLDTPWSVPPPSQGNPPPYNG
jgi:tyrosinase